MSARKFYVYPSQLNTPPPHKNAIDTLDDDMASVLQNKNLHPDIKMAMYTAALSRMKTLAYADKKRKVVIEQVTDLQPASVGDPTKKVATCLKSDSVNGDSVAVDTIIPVSYTHLTLPTICSV